MFPGIKLMSQTYKDLQKAILNAVNSQGIVNHPDWNLKTIQHRYRTAFVSEIAESLTRSKISETHLKKICNMISIENFLIFIFLSFLVRLYVVPKCLCMRQVRSLTRRIGSCVCSSVAVRARQ
ncbi:unnamed protein product [Trichogramma brassicae]|uniref:Uncharacterized protein n=1 Tax=Trichogramma brassicae TaxID=86971 RepID=A0A6H5I8V8_9HYME|nr:unnamed protein product [Trichogramma brassicae]